MQAPSNERLLSLCHLFSRNDLLYNICALFLPLRFLLLARCPSTYQAVSSDILTFYKKRKGSEWVSLQTHALSNNQQTLCTLTTFECCYRIKRKGREQNCLRTGDVTVFFRRQPLDPLRLMCSRKLKSCDKRSFNSLVHHLRRTGCWTPRLGAQRQAHALLKIQNWRITNPQSFKEVA